MLDLSHLRNWPWVRNLAEPDC